jgi:hypothetical protein
MVGVRGSIPLAPTISRNLSKLNKRVGQPAAGLTTVERLVTEYIRRGGLITRCLTYARRGVIPSAIMIRQPLQAATRHFDVAIGPGRPATNAAAGGSEPNSGSAAC